MAPASPPPCQPVAAAPASPACSAPALSLGGQGHLGEHYRYTEETIYPGDPLYAIGLFKSFDETDRQALIKAHASDLLRQWKQDHPELLARFDRNGDSRIDLDEWDQARRQAHRQATREEAAADRQNLHTLSNTGTSRRPFIISSHAEFKLVTRLQAHRLRRHQQFFSRRRHRQLDARRPTAQLNFARIGRTPAGPTTGSHSNNLQS